MNTLKKICTAAAIAVALCGCMNLTVRPRSEYNQGPYFYTKLDGKAIKRGFDGHPLSQLALPLTLIDYPLDGLVDTIFLPWDYFAGKGRN